MFIHDALEELITCGETDISAGNLRVKVNKLHKIVPGKATSGFEDQFKVGHGDEININLSPHSMATVFSIFSSSRFRVCPELDWHKKHQGSFHSNHELTTIKKMQFVCMLQTQLLE